MAYPKFIITQDGYLRLGMVTLHRHLIEAGDECLGGGYWRINHFAKEIELSGASSDYGAPQWHRINKLHLPEGYEGYNFVWNIGGKRLPLPMLLKQNRKI